MARQVTIKAFDGWIADEANVLRALELIAGGTTLQKVSTLLKQPYTCLRGYFHSTPELLARYEDARRSWVDFRNDQLVESADGVAADRDEIAKVKLQAEVIANQSKAYYRERWGERVQVEKAIAITVDAGPATRLLREMREREQARLAAPIEVSDG